MASLIETNKSLEVSRGRTGSEIAPRNFGEVMQFAQAMAIAGTAIPKHLRNNEGACMAVVMQALEWNMSPFAVANKSYSVNDRIAYEAQLFAAVVNTRSGIKGRLKYKFEGSGASLCCTVTGILDGEEATYTSPKFSDITPKNSPLWKSDPEQQLGYYCARAWARRHVPEVVLGVYDREEVADFEDITPERSEPPRVTSEKTEEPPKVEEAEVIEDEPVSFGSFETLGEYLTELEAGLHSAKTEEDLETIWNDFDPMATLEGDEDNQNLAVSLKERFLKALASSNDEPPSTERKLFSDE